MNRRMKVLGLLTGVAIFVLGCGSDDTTGPAGGGGDFTDFSAAELNALISALQGVQSLDDAGIADFASLAQGLITEIGEADGFDAFGIAVVFDISGGGESITGASAAVFGWTGLSTSGNSVSTVITAGGIVLGAQSFTGPAEITDAGPGFGGFFDATAMNNYEASSGNFTLSSSSFSGSAQDCTRTIEGTTIPCSAVGGQMSGSFNFVGDLTAGTGAPTFTQPSTSFSVPAVQLTISLTL